MIQIVFEPYTINSPIPEQRSNIAFMMLQSAIMNTEVRGDDPKSATMWVAMNDLMNGIAELEHVYTEDVQTPQGVQQIRAVILKETGGTLELSETAFGLLKKIWDAHKPKLNLSHARHVIAVEGVLASARPL